MATLTFTIGSVSASVTISDAKARELVGGYIEAHLTVDGPPVAADATATQKLTWTTRQMAREFRDIAVRQISKNAAEAARLAAVAEGEATDWT